MPSFTSSADCRSNVSVDMEGNSVSNAGSMSWVSTVSFFCTASGFTPHQHCSKKICRRENYRHQSEIASSARDYNGLKYLSMVRWDLTSYYAKVLRGKGLEVVAG